MRRNLRVTLTVHNLKIPDLSVLRERDAEIAEANQKNKVLVKVLSDDYDTAADRNLGDPMKPPKDFDPEVPEDTRMGSDEQPTITVARKILGELAVSPGDVTAGSERDFTITYKATEDLEEKAVIEVMLPKGWDPPRPDGINGTGKPEGATGAHIYLSGSTSQFGDTEVDVISVESYDAYSRDGERDDSVTSDMGWFVRVVLAKKVSNGSTVVLKYDDATVQRDLTSDDNPAEFVAFSGPVESGGVPQFPVKEQVKDIITVKHAVDGSGMVMFDFEGKNVTSRSGAPSNTEKSVFAGVTKDDELELTVTYTPDGDMGAGQFEVRLPSGWSAETVRSDGNESNAELSGDTVTATLPEDFGSSESDKAIIVLENITVPNRHGDHAFISRSKNVGGNTKQLSPRPMVLVGNTMADKDAVTVNITPKAAFVNQDNVDFEVTLTANGPMHDSEIRITVPNRVTEANALQTDKSSNRNYVRMPRSSSGADMSIDGDDIKIMTGTLNTDGVIRVRIDNVDVRPVSPEPDEGFRVYTKTRGAEIVDPDDETEMKMIVDLSDVQDVPIETIDGGKIRAIAGSGTMEVDRTTVEQGDRNVSFKLTFTAQTDFEKLGLVIEVPSVIESALQEDRVSGEGYVTSPDKAKLHEDDTDNDLKISGSTITWGMLTLKRGQKFVTEIKRVDIGADTDTFTWEVTLGDDPILDADEPKTVVVGTVEDDVIFEIVDGSGIPDSNPSYPASSYQSIRFMFEADNTAIQPNGSLSFSVPSLWTRRPSVTDRTGFATVAIVTKDADGDGKEDDGDEHFVSAIPSEGTTKGEKMSLSVSGRTVELKIGSKGGLDEGDSVTIRYGDSTDPKKYPVKISADATEESDSAERGLAIRGYFKVNDSAGFRRHAAGTIWAVVTNVDDGKGAAELTRNPPTTRAGSTKNEITVEFTGTGTMDGGAVRLTIPDDWGLMQDNTLKRNYIEVDVSRGAMLGDVEIVDDGLAVEANLTTFGEGDVVTFIYGGGDGDRESGRGAEAQEDIGEAIFMVESQGSSDGGFVNITDDDAADTEDPLAFQIKGAESGSGDGVVEIMATKALEGLYDGETDVDRNDAAGPCRRR